MQMLDARRRHIGNMVTTSNKADASPPPGPKGAILADRFFVGASPQPPGLPCRAALNRPRQNDSEPTEIMLTDH